MALVLLTVNSAATTRCWDNSTLSEYYCSSSHHFLYDNSNNNTNNGLSLLLLQVQYGTTTLWRKLFDSHAPFVAYVMLYSTIPYTSLFNDSFEKKYDPIPVLDWMRENPMIPVGACVMYGVLIMVGQYVMQKRESWNLRRIMAFWNLGLSVFSWIGMARTLPQLLHNLYYMSPRDNLCMDRT